jgi:predicted NodU family carbamoyl transferase
MTHILGVSAYYHDSAACLLQDGPSEHDRLGL